MQPMKWKMRFLSKNKRDKNAKTDFSLTAKLK